MMVQDSTLFWESHFLGVNKALEPYEAEGNDTQQQRAGAHSLADVQDMERKGKAESQTPEENSRAERPQVSQVLSTQKRPGSGFGDLCYTVLRTAQKTPQVADS